MECLPVTKLPLSVNFIAKNYLAIRFASYFKRKRESFFLSENKTHDARRTAREAKCLLVSSSVIS